MFVIKLIINYTSGLTKMTVGSSGAKSFFRTTFRVKFDLKKNILFELISQVYLLHLGSFNSNNEVEIEVSYKFAISVSLEFVAWKNLGGWVINFPRID